MAPSPRRAAQGEAAAYANGADRPLGSFVVLIGAYTSLVAMLAWLARHLGQELPEHLGPSDLALLAVGTHKIARLLAKDPVTSPLRAPFTRYVGIAGAGEVDEEVRGTGPRRAVGELVTCPFCLGQWVATVLAFGLLVAPRATRLTCGTFAALTGADALQLLYQRLQP